VKCRFIFDPDRGATSGVCLQGTPVSDMGPRNPTCPRARPETARARSRRLV